MSWLKTRAEVIAASMGMGDPFSVAALPIAIEALAREFAERAAVETWREMEHIESGRPNSPDVVRELYGSTIEQAIAEADKEEM